MILNRESRWTAAQGTLVGSEVDLAVLPNLSYTQAIIFLGIPEEERDSFMAENDVAGMSTRELKQAVKERD